MKSNPVYRTSGTAILSAVILSVVLSIIVATVLTFVASERRMNVRLQSHQEASLAAEALTEYGVAQIRQKFTARSNVTLGSSGADSVVLPPTTFWTGGKVNTSTLELKAGTVTPVVTGSGGTLYYVNPNDVANLNDPNRGQWVMRADVELLAKATATSTAGGGAITSYAVQRLSIRSVPLFAHAVFYNMDLEVFPGPDMQIVGPVQVNGSAFLSSKGPSLGLRFLDTVNITGNVYHAWSTSNASSHGTVNESMGTSPVSFMAPVKDSNGVITGYAPLSMYDSSKSKWMDSIEGAQGSSGTLGISDSTQNVTDFPTYAANRWPGYLYTGQMGAMPYNPPAIGTYAPSAGNNTSATVSTPLTDTSVNSARQLIEPPNWPSSTDPDKVAKNEVELGKFSTNAGIYIQVDANAGTVTYMARSKNSTNPTKTFTSVPSGMVTYEKYAYDSSTSKVTAGMYDARRQIGVNTVDIDISKVKSAVDSMSGSSSVTGKIYGTSTNTSLQPSDWTGIIYVEVKGDPTTNIDGTTNPVANTTAGAAADATAVRIINGSVIPSYGTANPGLTIATNAPLYVIGHYNADGNITTNSDMTQSSACQAATNEKPSALVADAITVLSPGWSDANSRGGVQAASATVEISAAMLMGITPSNNRGNGASSGGLHNFPRFLENWSGKAVWIRGSLVALFESRVANEPWNTSYYSPPERDWGFNSLFRGGSFPPGTPMVRSFRRIEFKNLSAAEYAARKTANGW